MSAVIMPKGRKLIHEEVIPAKKGGSVVVKKGQHLRIIDVMGKQIGDLVFFNEDNVKEKLSTSISLARQWLAYGPPYNFLDKLHVGHIIYSTAYRPMMTIVADTPVPGGVHDYRFHECNTGLYEALGIDSRDGCWENISKAVAKYGIAPEEIPDPINVFQNSVHDVAAGEWHVIEPVSRPGDYIEFRAEMDCIAALSCCPADAFGRAPVAANGYVCTPLKIEAYEVEY